MNFHSYNQAFIKWDTTNIKPIDTLDLIGKLPLKYQKYTLNNSMSIKYFDTLKVLYKINNKKIHYIFISDKVLGFSGRSSSNLLPNHSNDIRFVIISYNAKNIYEIYTHELGHNNQLPHTFQLPKIKKIPEYSTQNYMDYSNILIYLWRWQGEKMRNIIFGPK